MPLGYEFLLEKILKTNIIEKDKIILTKENNNFGITQGGILSPLLMNWTLDGIDNLIFEVLSKIKNEIGTAYYDKEKYEYYKKQALKKKEIDPNFKLPTEAAYRKQATVELSYTYWLIRYGDDIVIGVKSEEALKTVKTSLDNFFFERGLCLSEDKTKIIK
jgi:retron-type reverse transcriptase